MSIPEQNALSEINWGAEEYVMYLTVQEGMPRREAREVATILRSLYWQAGEQMEYLLDQISGKSPDGKQFCMLIGFAYTILDNLEAVAERAHIGNKEGNHYSIKSYTNIIRHKKVFEKLPEEELTDWRYLRFLRSLICAHPLETSHERTIKGFLPNNRTICQYVDRIDNRLFYREEDLIYDYKVSLLYDSGNESMEDIKIVSSEIWDYVKYRYKELVTTIHETMNLRIESVYSTLRNCPIAELSNTYDSTKLDEIIMEDWRRNGHFHFDLMRLKVLLNYTNNSHSTVLKHSLINWLWLVVKQIHNKIQSLDYNDFYFRDSIYEVLNKIGFDSNQFNNFSYLDTHHYGTDADNYIDGGLNNYESIEVDSSVYTPYKTLSPQERNDIYRSISTKINLSELSKQSRINLVSSFYCYPENYTRAEVARFFMIAVIPEFVEQYDLYDKLVNGIDYDLYVSILACAVDYCYKN